MSKEAKMIADVTVCIPTYNQAPFLVKALESCLRQEWTPRSIIVSDDASTDQTREVVNDFALRDRTITYHRHPNNLGLGANADWVLRRADTEFVARIGSDDLLAPDFLSTLVPLLGNYPKAGYAHANVREIDESGQLTRFRRLGRTNEYEPGDSALLAGSRGYRVAANICLFRRAALKSVGFLAGHLNFAEDWDLSIRLADAGWGNVHSPRLLASYRVWTDVAKSRPRRKLAEIEGCRHVFEHSLEPAFKRRRLPLTALLRKRRRLAAGHALALTDRSLFTTEERANIVRALRGLGDGIALRSRLLAIGLGLGFPIELANKSELYLRDQVKGILCALRNRSFEPERRGTGQPPAKHSRFSV